MYNVHKTCLLCNSTDLFELNRFSKDYLVKCKNCDFVFCKRIPTTEDLLLHYQGYPRGGEISPITVKRYNQILDTFEGSRKTNNILDIGCGNGYFLEAAKKRGWNVFGTEFTEEATKICLDKGIIMHTGVFNPDNYPNSTFDVITSFEVIEHINNPQTEIHHIRKALRNNGLFYFTTPNFNSVSRFILKETWSIIEFPEHLSYYTPQTMDRFLSQNGFKKIKVESTGISLTRFHKASSVSNTNSTVNKDENFREKTETKLLFKIIKRTANFFLNLLKMGDSLKGLYQKL